MKWFDTSPRIDLNLFIGRLCQQIRAPLLALLLIMLCTDAYADEAGTESLIKQGEQALKAGKPEQAELIFERILMDQPWRLGVWLDYALSLQQTGDNDSARAIYQSLLEKNPPEYLVPWLKQQVKAGAPLTADWHYAGAVTLLSGYDSNLNHAQAAGTLALTLPSGTLVLPLTRAAQAVAGASQFVNMDWQAAHPDDEGNWLVQAGFNSRLAPGNSDQNYQQSSLGLSRSWTGDAAQEYRGVVAAQNLEYGGIDIQRTMRAGLYQGKHWQRQESVCSISHGVEWEKFDYPTATELNGQYIGLAGELGCRQSLDWMLMLSAGVNRGDSLRPGGQQRQVELHAELGGQAGKGSWLAVTELTGLRDSTGYSPLLDNNATRGILQGMLRLEYRYPLAARLQGIASTEVFRQYSNLQLFALNGSAAWLGIRWLF